MKGSDRFDRWVSVTVGIVCTFTTLVHGVTLVVQPDVRLELRSGPHVVNEVDRQRYFRIYHFPGMFSEALAEQMKELGIIPGRGTGPYLKDPGGDAERAGWSDSHSEQFLNYVKYFRTAKARYGDIPFAMAGGNYPEGGSVSGGDAHTQVDPTMVTKHSKGVQPVNFDLCVDLIRQWLRTLRENNAPLPTYFSLLNEPDATWDNTPDPVQDFLDFSRLMAVELKDEFPEVEITGPCTAWGHPKGDWARWLRSGWERKFIEHVGDVAGAYDFHIYSKEYWAYENRNPDGPEPPDKLPYPNLYDQFSHGGIYIWDFGKAQAFLDLVFAHHQATWASPSLPVIITEFGRQGIHPQTGPWESEYKYYLYATTVTRLWMTFMDRPEVVMTVPFILPESDRGYASKRGQALYTRPNAPDDLSTKPTPFLQYYGFFKGLKGDRVVSRWRGLSPAEAVGLFAIATRDGNKLWVLVHNAPNRPVELNLQIPTADLAGPVRIARMRWEGEVPQTHAQITSGKWRIDLQADETVDLSRIHLAPEETALVKVDLSTPHPYRQQIVDRYYASQTLEPLDSQADTPSANFTIDLPPESCKGQAQLVAGFASPQGPEPGTRLWVWVNGQRTSVVLDFAEGARDLFAPVCVDMPLARSSRGPIRYSFSSKPTRR